LLTFCGTGTSTLGGGDRFDEGLSSKRTPMLLEALIHSGSMCGATKEQSLWLSRSIQRKTQAKTFNSMFTMTRKAYDGRTTPKT